MEVWAAEWGVPLLESHRSIGSTNLRLRELARGGAASGTVVIAEEQTAGRGRRGRSWYSPPRVGLWLSYLTVPVNDSTTPTLPLVAGIAAARAVESSVASHGGRITVQIKWPNDLVARGRKLGGILCERDADRVTVGVGINLRPIASGAFGSRSIPGYGPTDESPTSPSPTPSQARTQQTVSWAGAGSVADASGIDVNRATVATLLVRGLSELMSCTTTRLSPELHGEISARDALRGQHVHTEAGATGTGAGIATDGALLLDRADGSRVRVVAGSVRAASLGNLAHPDFPLRQVARHREPDN